MVAVEAALTADANRATKAMEKRILDNDWKGVYVGWEREGKGEEGNEEAAYKKKETSYT